MRPRSVSATALANARDCMAKYKAVSIDYTPEVGRKEPARFGKALHYALQHFVAFVYLDKTLPWALAELLKLWDEAYLVEFETADRRTSWYREGIELLTAWFERTDLANVTVLAVEQKHQTSIPSSRYDKSFPAHKQPHNGAVVPLRYIWDRVDTYVDPWTGERVLRIVDYKSQYVPPPSLARNIQAQIYAMVAMIHFKDEKFDRILVVFDLLRFENPMKEWFTREECVQIWVDVRREIQRILDTPSNNPPRTLGAGCRYCPISATCSERAKNLSAGGLTALSLDEMVKLRADIEAQSLANKALMEQIDLSVKQEAIERDSLEFFVGGFEVEVTTPTYRKIDLDKARVALGDERFGQLVPITMKKYDEWMKPENIFLTEEEKGKLEKCLEIKSKEPKLVVHAESE